MKFSSTTRVGFSSTTRAGVASKSRYIEVFLDGAYISRHSDAFEAVESAITHCDTLAPGDYEYELRYPNKMILIQKEGVIAPPPPPVAPALTISSVNGGSSPRSNQSTVQILGSSFGLTQGTVSYSGVELVVLNWTDAQIDVAWPDVPFSAAFSSLDFDGEQRSLLVSTPTDNDSTLVATQPGAAAQYAVIISAAEDSIYFDDLNIQLGVDKGYIRPLAGTFSNINAATGVISGASDGASLEYAVFDVSLRQWAN